VFTEGREPRVYPGLGTIDEVVAISDPALTFSAIGTPTQLPSTNAGVALTGGHNRGPALALGADAASDPLLELVPAPKATGDYEVAVTQGTSTIDGATPVVALDVFANGAAAESYANLTLDPDDVRYLPAVLAGSSLLLRAKDLSVRSRTSSLPRGPAGYPLVDGIAPSTDDYQDALDRLEGAEEVDLVIAAVARELVDDADVRTVHQAVVAHCTKMADVARNRIGLGSVTAGEAATVSGVLDHADDVRSDHFVLVAPNGLEAAVAGLLGRQDYFESPTFKTIASPEATPGSYTDAQLEQLILGNVAVVNERRRRGVIVVKGLLTSGMQINVRRTANKAVRDVQALAERYIGLLNNEGSRRALLQQVTALLGQMERDGALVPSTDGQNPAFAAAVYSSQNDAALGIVRIDIAVRPVRAIDYVFATILLQN
jgi:Phage tail sheath protein subtilisin-like domain